MKSIDPSQILIAPSLLSADFTRLGEAIELMEKAGADLLHCDVMDGHFVPNLTFGPPVIAAIKKHTDIPLDVHLMISNTDDTIGWYIAIEPRIISVHAESCIHLHRVIQQIKDAGILAGVVLNPGSSLHMIDDIIEMVDLVMLMGVNPGFGGQSFIESVVDKCIHLDEMCQTHKIRPIIEVDGGINAANAPRLLAAGANCFVAGNAVLGAVDPINAYQELRDGLEAAHQEISEKRNE
ncbi:MAG: ribulose-phosphate 3-epimerase [Actinomycetia bacterium]|nr:ribulose-phosphate 3-epimerase [Actinomycetes bacterium]